jgi:hypothetical protein
MRHTKGLAIVTSLLGVLIFTLLTFSYSDFVALVRAQYGDYDSNPAPVTIGEVRELFAEKEASDPDFEVTDEQLETLSELVLVRALIDGSVSEEMADAITAIILECPDVIALAYTGGDGESDDIQASVDAETDSGIGLAESGEGAILVASEVEAVFPVEDVAANLLSALESLAQERFGDDVDLATLDENEIAGLIVAMDSIVFAIEPDFLLEAVLLDYDPSTGYVSIQATIISADDIIIGEGALKLAPVGEAENEAEQEYIVGLAPLPQD